jgi:hypothetical protein
MRPKKDEHLCAGCNGLLKDEVIEFDLPAGMTFSEIEFFIFGRSQFCDTCIKALESGDNVEYVQ